MLKLFNDEVNRPLFSVIYSFSGIDSMGRWFACLNYFRLAARILLYASSNRQDNTYHGFITPVVEHWPEQEIVQ